MLEIIAQELFLNLGFKFMLHNSLHVCAYEFSYSNLLFFITNMTRLFEIYDEHNILFLTSRGMTESMA